MARTEWLSEGAEKLAFAKPDIDGFDCDIAIVGSGYGGAVAAARLAGLKETEDNRPSRVWLLERGNEFVPGAFPERFADLIGQARVSWGEEPRTSGRPEGLFDLRLGSDVSTLLGNGLGGGSLINAGVLARPLDSVFRPPWPAGLDTQALAPYFADAEEMLGGDLHPGPAPAKLRAIEALGKTIDGREAERRARIAVTFVDGKKTPADVAMHACIGCGDCFTGCNHEAKNTLATNYLPLARRRGARLLTGVTVLALDGSDASGWELDWRFTDRQIAKRIGAPRKLRAWRVILAAGAYGSTGILLRSRQNGFKRLSHGQLGQRFSTNGDMIAAGYGMPADIDASAPESTPPGERRIGPTITGMIDLRMRRVPLVIEELAIPAALRRPFEEVVTTSGLLHGLARPDYSLHRAAGRGADPAAIDPQAIRRTAVYATMGDDGAKGAIKLASQSLRADDPLRLDGDLRVEWEGVADREVFREAMRVLEEAHAACGATVMPNPMWRALPGAIGSVLDDGPIGGSVFTVHPLGGCAMAESGKEGVVNRLGQVFEDGGEGAAVHETLVVLDGAIVPTALEINPCLTIAALAEYAVKELARGWKLADGGKKLDDLRPAPRLPAPLRWPAGEPTAIRLAERLTGELTLGVGTAWGAFLRTFDAKLEIEYRPLADLERFLASRSKTMPIAKGRLHLQSAAQPGASGIEAVQWSGTVELEGELRPFEREDSTPRGRILYAGVAWLRNRGAREICLMALGYLKKLLRGEAGKVDLGKYFKDWIAIASNAGERRRLTYELVVRRDVFFGPEGPGAARLLAAGDRLVGEKRIAYFPALPFLQDRWPSPWDQLTKLTLHLYRGASRGFRTGTLEVDLPYFVQQYATQLQVARQENQPRAIADLYSFFAYLVRLIGKIHIWSFRAPDYPNPYPEYEFPDKFNEQARRDAYAAAEAANVELEPRLEHRLPGHVRGLRRTWIDVPAAPNQRPPGREPRQHELEPQIRLTHYERRTWFTKRRQPRPVLLIHGLGASGNTFTLPTVCMNLVRYLAKRGFDPWVLDLRTSIGLASSKRDWSFDETAFGDIPTAIDLVRKETRCDQIDVIAHCIGAAMFSMAALDGKLPQNSVRKAVLSQAGPLMELPPANRFRGYLASYFKHYLEIDEFDTTASLTRFNRFVDRVLAAYPYPRHEWKEHLALLPGRLKHEAFCLRSYGIYGRLFEHANLNRRTLNRLGDYIGHIRYRTYQQTIFYATLRRLTDPFGRNVFVTPERIERHLAFPLCFVHGKENEVFHVRTSRRSFDLLASIFWWEDLDRAWTEKLEARNEYAPYADGKRLRILEVEGYGHQDCMIGRRAHRDVFPGICDFLAQDAEGTIHKTPQVFVVRPPRLGPILGYLRREDGRPAARILFAPNDSRSKPLYAISIVVRGGEPLPGYAGFHRLIDLAAEEPPAQALDVALPDGKDCTVVVLTVHHEHYEPEPLREAGEPPVDDPFGEDLDRFPWVDLPPNLEDALKWEAKRIDEVAGPILETCRDLGLEREPLGSGRRVCDPRYATAVSAAMLSSNVLRAADPDAVDGAVCFAVASCRYASTVMDRELADVKLGRLRDLVERPAAGARTPQFLFLAGDAIYADATYGVFDPTLDVERYDQRYLEAWTAPNAREVMRRLPTYPMLDDHEVEENFEGIPTSKEGKAGLRAFESFQLLLTPRRRAGQKKEYWYDFSAGGFEFFVADTRTGRTREGLEASIGADQMGELFKWLAQAHEDGIDKPKFIVSPSVVAPWSRETSGHRAYSLRSDAWDAFPDALHELLGFIVGNGIRNVVFLSGDYHTSLFCEMELAAKGGSPVRAYSIVSSGLYSPYPFANTRAEDLELCFNGTHRDWLGGSDAPCCDRWGELVIRYRTKPMAACASFAVVGVEPRRGGESWMTVKFDEGQLPVEVRLC